jgi:hypothetical protein
MTIIQKNKKKVETILYLIFQWVSTDTNYFPKQEFSKCNVGLTFT